MNAVDGKILVAYATKYGSTQEVAKSVASALTEDGLAVELLPARQVKSLASYRAVVLGAPLYIGHFHKDALRFLSQHQAALTRLPAALFVLGPTTSTEADWQGVRENLDQELVKMDWFKPVAVQLFGGKYDPARLRFPDSLLASLPASPLHGMPASELRDCEAIRSWASELPGKLQPVPLG